MKFEKISVVPLTRPGHQKMARATLSRREREKTGKLLIIVTALSGLLAFQFSTPIDLQLSTKDRLNVFDKAWKTVNQYFFDSKFNGVNWAQMKEKYRPVAASATDKTQLLGIIGPMLNELRASHMGVRADFTIPPYGIGAGYLLIEGKWVVSWVAPGSPAQRGGIERGWILTSPERDCTAQNSKLNLQLLDLNEQAQRLEVPCATYAPPPTPTDNFRELENGAIYLRLTSFSPAPAQWLGAQLERNKSAKAIVLDLRGNSGGGTDTQRKVFDMFFAAKTVIGKFRFRGGKEYTLKTGGNKSAYAGKLFVLTDRFTQSASEVFAQAIQETGRGVIVGEGSNGGVLLGNHFKLPNGFDLHVAVADYHSAKGIRLEGRGVIPDVAVQWTVRDIREKKDPVLDRVSQLMRQP